MQRSHGAVSPQVRTYLDGLAAEMPPVEKLQALVRWSLEQLIADEMPHCCPAGNSSLRAVLMADKNFLKWAGHCQRPDRGMDRAGPGPGLDQPHLAALGGAVCTLYARACNPVVTFLKDGGQYWTPRSWSWWCAPVLTGCRRALILGPHMAARSHTGQKKAPPGPNASQLSPQAT